LAGGKGTYLGAKSLLEVACSWRSSQSGRWALEEEVVVVVEGERSRPHKKTSGWKDPRSVSPTPNAQCQEGTFTLFTSPSSQLAISKLTTTTTKTLGFDFKIFRITIFIIMTGEKQKNPCPYLFTLTVGRR
jgi:hypothetical protein